ncbi:MULTISPECIES: nucleoside deaminase [unclassified Paenibacillus]|uniref:nucleoside deaminase n=1 Tax=unclassified Paenibacillus TaxID=185978 RepID=UPI001C10BA44|nr:MULTISPECIES: nucleoside deaminase [unclassified Paenibacillus]MBU5442401.1 nucleoside deaminase [Paenibacillus sp. MSJ-34]CAH0119437.1 Guanine deaminase [Paenibacillus sp. CECT 9249]
MNRHEYMCQAIELACENVKEKGGRPFGAVIVKDGDVVATGVNEVMETHDPTTHAEMQAIRAASRALQTADLSDCVLFASGEPCPMCLSAIYWANIKDVYYSYTEEDAAQIGLSTKYVYEQIALPKEERDIHLRRMDKRAFASDPFALWKKRET